MIWCHFTVGWGDSNPVWAQLAVLYRLDSHCATVFVRDHQPGKVRGKGGTGNHVMIYYVEIRCYFSNVWHGFINNQLYIKIKFSQQLINMESREVLIWKMGPCPILKQIFLLTFFDHLHPLNLTNKADTIKEIECSWIKCNHIFCVIQVITL
jgi:hypothetical protein